jgi:hypothetical protein
MWVGPTKPEASCIRLNSSISLNHSTPIGLYHKRADEMNPDGQASPSEVDDTARDTHALRRAKILIADSFVSYQLLVERKYLLN